MGAIRAVQWDGTKGHVEYADSQNTVLKTINPFSNIVQMWEDAAPPEPVPPEDTDEVPQVVSMRQARLALLQAGLLSAIGPAIATLPSPQKEAAEIEWEYSQEVQRTKPLVVSLGAMLGLNSEQLDDLFRIAGEL
jgi:hypothetical protein